jgi:toxin ParE1/3/4
MRLTISPQAEADLEEAWEYIAERSPRAAQQFDDDIRERWSVLRRFPEMGRSRAELGKGLRSFIVGSYTVVYEIEEDRIVILRVIHGARDVPSFFNPLQ